MILNTTKTFKNKGILKIEEKFKPLGENYYTKLNNVELNKNYIYKIVFNNLESIVLIPKRITDFTKLEISEIRDVYEVINENDFDFYHYEFKNSGMLELYKIQYIIPLPQRKMVIKLPTRITHFDTGKVVRNVSVYGTCKEVYLNPQENVVYLNTQTNDVYIPKKFNNLSDNIFVYSLTVFDLRIANEEDFEIIKYYEIFKDEENKICCYKKN